MRRHKTWVWIGSLGRKLFFCERVTVFMLFVLTAIVLYGAVIVWREPMLLPYWITPAAACPMAWITFFIKKEEKQNVQKSNERIALFNKKNETTVPYHQSSDGSGIVSGTYDMYNNIGGGNYG